MLLSTLIIKRKFSEEVGHSCNLSTWETGAGGLTVRGQPVLHSVFQESLICRVRSHVKTHFVDKTGLGRRVPLGECWD